VVLALPVSTGLLSTSCGRLQPRHLRPFHLMAYVAADPGLPAAAVVFTAGVTFALGRWTGRPILSSSSR